MFKTKCKNRAISSNCKTKKDDNDKLNLSVNLILTHLLVLRAQEMDSSYQTITSISYLAIFEYKTSIFSLSKSNNQD